MAKRHKELVVNQLAANNPPVKESIAKEMLDFSRHEFNSRMIQTSIARLQCVAAEGLEVVAAVDDVFSWRNPYVTAFVQCVLFFMINYPRLIVPGILFLVGSVPCAMFWTRKSARSIRSRWISTSPSSSREAGHPAQRRRADQRGDQSAERENRARRRWSSRWSARRKEKQRRDEAESAEAVMTILAEADMSRPRIRRRSPAPKMAGSMNPFTNLMRQYEELTR